MTKTKILSSVALLCLSISCHKSDPEPDCGCNSKAFDQVVNLSASYVGGYNFLVRVGNNNGSTAAWVTLCQPIDTINLINNIELPKYKLYGKLKNVCLPEGVHPILPLYNLSLDSLTFGNAIIKAK